MPDLYDVTAIGNAIVDVIAPATDAFLAEENLAKGAMTLIDEARAERLYGKMASGVEASGGSAANTIAGIASLGGRAAFIGKVADDPLGKVFAHDMRAIGASFDTPPLKGGPATARSLINVTPEGQRTMATFLGASNALTADDVDIKLIEASKIIYLEGYLFDPDEARRAFAKAAGLARANDRLLAFTLSDPFVVDRHRAALLDFIETQVDILFANHSEVTSLFQTGDFEVALAAVRDLPLIGAVTRSEKGSVVVADGEIHFIDAFPVGKVLDTTGAGDQYAAGFLHGLAQDKPLDVCGRLGSMAAAEAISHYGPRPQVSLKALAAQNGL